MPSSAGMNESDDSNERKGPKYQCPSDFVSFLYKPGVRPQSGKKHKELWLIKAPAGFDPESFLEKSVPLSGFGSVQTATQKNYNVLGSTTGAPNLHLLTANSEGETVSLSDQAFAGVLNICESYGNCGEDQEPVTIAAAPAPRVPLGLKQRFRPFGSDTPSCTTPPEAKVSPSLPKRIKLEPDDCEHHKKKKKKKEKTKERDEQTEEMHIKQEVIDPNESQSQLPTLEEEDVGERKRKKKKRKKEKEGEDGQSVGAMDIKTEIKEESNISFGDTDSSGKKKKKKKKHD